MSASVKLNRNWLKLDEKTVEEEVEWSQYVRFLIGASIYGRAIKERLEN
jgi:menaquinone-dependent protoporphyrinogen IX oxidase